MSKAGSKPMSRTGCLIGVLIWLCVMALPFLALALAVKGELAWRRSEFVEDRLWLVNAETGLGSRGASGIGYSAARVVSDQTAADGPVCVRMSIYFLLWEGESEGVTFCDCYVKRAAAGGGYEPSGSCP